MKRLIPLSVAMILAFSITGCSSTDKSEVSSVQTVQEHTEFEADTPDTENAGTDDKTKSAQSENKERDVLILYFSAANLKNVDAVTSATPLVDGVASVEWMANIIQENTGGDIAKIIPSEDYPLSYQDAADVAKKEADNEIHPAIEPLDVDPSAYKTVFLGYPVWWYRMPMVLETFFDTYDFSGVIIIPFNTHEGSRDGGTYDMIRDREPDAIVLDGLPMRGGSTGEDSAKEEIQEWINGLNLGRVEDV